MFTWRDAERLKKECEKSLRKNKHKAAKSHLRNIKRKRFAKPDDSKIREINNEFTYWDWVELHNNNKEPLEANPDLFDDDTTNTVD